MILKSNVNIRITEAFLFFLWIILACLEEFDLVRQPVSNYREDYTALKTGKIQFPMEVKYI